VLKITLKKLGAVHLNTVQMPTATHSDRCLEIFHYSRAVSGWWAIESCPFKHHSKNSVLFQYNYKKITYLNSEQILQFAETKCKHDC